MPKPDSKVHGKSGDLSDCVRQKALWYYAAEHLSSDKFALCLDALQLQAKWLDKYTCTIIHLCYVYTPSNFVIVFAPVFFSLHVFFVSLFCTNTYTQNEDDRPCY